MKCFSLDKDGNAKHFTNIIETSEVEKIRLEGKSVFETAVYLAVIDKIHRETYNVLLDYSQHGQKNITNDSFWLANKYVLDYVNSIYNLKEYIENYDGINSYDSEIYHPVDSAYKRTDSWFRFICELRNCLIHHNGLIKTFDKEGKLWISIDEFIIAEQAQLEYEKKKKKKTEEREEFIHNLERYQGVRMASDGHKYIPVHDATVKIEIEIKCVLSDVFDVLFETKLKKVLNDLILLVQQDDMGFYRTVYYEDDETYIPFEPCVDIEGNLLYFIINAGPDSTIVNKYTRFLHDSNYHNCLNNTMSIDDMVSSARSRGY